MFLSTAALVLGLSSTQGGPSSSEPCALPGALREALQSRLGSSRVLTHADLFEDERALFRADHPGACPGVRAGKFFGAKERTALAVIVMGVGPKKNVRLVVARPALAAWILFEVDELHEGSTAVVGTESGPTPPDVLTLSAYEAWKRGYRWNGRAFEAIAPRE